MTQALTGPSKSATARLAHNGADGPSSSRFTWAFAHGTSFEGSRKESPAENAMPKNRNVSTTEPMAEETSGAFHQVLPFRWAAAQAAFRMSVRHTLSASEQNRKS